MHDISDNRYIDTSFVPLEKYDLNTFLFKEIATEKRADTKRVMFTVSSMLALLGFDIRLLGFKLMTYMVSNYIVKHDYNEKKIIADLADMHSVAPEIISGCIDKAIEYNTDFINRASRALMLEIRLAGVPTVTETIEILGAIYKYYYNYTVTDEIFEYELNPAINFSKVEFKSGKKQQ